MSSKINILFLGDIVGRVGRYVVRDYLASLEENLKPDFVIANVENASHGFGLTEKNYNELLSYGINAMTSGNHIWDKRDIFTYINNADKLVRPINYPADTPGCGGRVFDAGTFKIGVINVLGRTFMNPVESPWTIVVDEIKKMKDITPIIFVDFHAEATAEKICFGKYCAKHGVSIIVGTHTHVQTADEKILDNTTAYITDAGFCGDANGVIGMDYETSLRRLITSLPERFDVADTKEAQVNGINVTINTATGDALCIKRINFTKNSNEVSIMQEG